jgi:hypothetical protein
MPTGSPALLPRSTVWTVTATETDGGRVSFRAGRMDAAGVIVPCAGVERPTLSHALADMRADARRFGPAFS